MYFSIKSPSSSLFNAVHLHVSLCVNFQTPGVELWGVGGWVGGCGVRRAVGGRWEGGLWVTVLLDCEISGVWKSLQH